MKIPDEASSSSTRRPETFGIPPTGGCLLLRRAASRQQERVSSPALRRGRGSQRPSEAQQFQPVDRVRLRSGHGHIVAGTSTKIVNRWPKQAGKSMKLGQEFDPRNNALNAWRLTLATGVILWHSFALTGRHLLYAPARQLLGEAWVDGFLNLKDPRSRRSAPAARGPARFAAQAFASSPGCGSASSSLRLSSPRSVWRFRAAQPQAAAVPRADRVRPKKQRSVAASARCRRNTARDPMAGLVERFPLDPHI